MKNKPGIVIIGGGHAGINAIEALRKNGCKEPIYLIDADPDVFYYRAAMKYLIKKHIDEDQLKGRAENFFKENKVTLIQQKAKFLNIAIKTVVLDDEREVNYTKLLLAIGGEPFIPPIPGVNLKGVYPQRSLADTRAICNLADKGQNKRCLVLGAGVLGTELAEALKERGIDVEIFTLDPILVPRMIDEKASHIIEQEFNKRNIKIHFKMGFKEIIGNENSEVGGVVTNDGKKINCDGVFICTGIRPNTQLAKDAGLQVKRGIITNQFMQTSDPDVYAAGDVIEFYDEATKSHRFVELWGPAGKMGSVAAFNILGKPTPFNLGAIHAYTVFWGHNCHSIGEYNPAPSNQIKILQNESQGAYTHNYIKLIFNDRQLIGALTLGEARDPLYATEIIGMGLKVPQNISLEALLEPEFDWERILYQKK